MNGSCTNRIVKIIHQIWLDLGGGPDVPDKYVKYQLTWKKNFPNWQYILWTDSLANKFIQKYYPDLFDIYEHLKYGVMKVDMLRYLILSKFGGLYADIDVICLNNMEPYFCKYPNKSLFFVITRNPMVKRTVSNFLIYTTKNNPFWTSVIQEMIHRIKTKTFFLKYFYVLGTTGPKMLNYVLSKLDPSEISKVQFMPMDQFNFKDLCGNSNPSTTEILYSYHDYDSHWTEGYLSYLRKTFLCNKKNIVLAIVIVILIVIILFKLLK